MAYSGNDEWGFLLVNRQRDYLDDGLTLGGILLTGAGCYFLLGFPLLLLFIGLLLLCLGAYRSR